ncbi:amino acid permease [Corynebacterium poyangense]|uniref:Amino acid permease n=1 Tax=Corynebacterium poyangense TaxID=2684405 RepID=A0A7H0SLZ4_9CORY|nr:APC family permease [Corynebacterium poyangense]MBZ8177678.1 amino acid permease [Corynebacterium poyangense]QNQ89569.1 amino acid permease [Corynebacterium poyangense]
MPRQELNKTLGFIPLVALGVSGVIGSSWIYTNGTFFEKYGAGGMIFGLAIGTVLAACVALSYAKLTALFPRAGGEVVYSYTILGRQMGFIVGWLLIGAYISSLAFYFTAFGVLLELVFPQLSTLPLYSIAGANVTLPVLICGLALALLFYFLNYFGISLGAQVQTVLFGILIVIGLSLAVVGFSQGSIHNFWPAYYEDRGALLSTLRFVVPGMTYMAGFGLVATLAEDAKLPSATIGRLVVLTVLLAGTFYCVVLAASAFILPWKEVATMDQGSITAFRQAGFPLLGWGAFIIAIVGLLTSFLGLFMASSRIVFALARVRLLPPNLAKLHPQHHTPRDALLFVLILTIGLGWLGKGAVGWFLDTGGIYLGLVWLIVVISHLRAPRRYPHLKDRIPPRSVLLPLVGAIGAVLVIILALYPGTDLSLIWPMEYIILGGWFLLGGLLYAFASPLPEDQALADLLGEHVDTLSSDPTSTVPGREAQSQRR